MAPLSRPVRRRAGSMLEFGAMGVFVLALLAPFVYRWATSQSGPAGLTDSCLIWKIGGSMFDQIRLELIRPPAPLYPVLLLHDHRVESQEPLATLTSHGQVAPTGLVEGEGTPLLARYLHVDDLIGKGSKDDKASIRGILANWAYVVEIRQIGLDTDLDGRDENDAAEVAITLSPLKGTQAAPVQRVTAVTGARARHMEVKP